MRTPRWGREPDDDPTQQIQWVRERRREETEPLPAIGEETDGREEQLSLRRRLPRGPLIAAAAVVVVALTVGGLAAGGVEPVRGLFAQPSTQGGSAGRSSDRPTSGGSGAPTASSSHGASERPSATASNAAQAQEPDGSTGGKDRSSIDHSAKPPAGSAGAPGHLPPAAPKAGAPKAGAPRPPAVPAKERSGNGPAPAPGAGPARGAG